MQYTSHDRALADTALLSFKVPDSNHTGYVRFQFPPKILSDNRRATWNEGELRGTEPVSVFATSGPREMALTWTYIVESTDGRGLFPLETIKENVNLVRGYFANIKFDASGNGLRDPLIVLFKYPMLTGPEPWTCRIKSTDVKHSDNLIGDPDNCYPLRTDITIDIRLWTDHIRSGASDAAVIDIGLKPEPVFDDLWY